MRFVPLVLGSLAVLARFASAEEAPLPPREMPAGDRAALQIPDDVWERALAGTAPSRRPLGMTGDEMRNYSGRDYLMRTVENQFRDARAIPRTTGRITDAMLTVVKAASPGEICMLCWGLTDIPSGRMYAAPTGDEWGIPEIAKGTTPEKALPMLLELESKGADHTAAIRDFAQLPEAVQRFLLRVAIARRLSLPWLRQSIATPADDPKGEGIRKSVTAPWTDEANDQSATLDARCFQWLRDVDRTTVAYGSAIFTSHLKTAFAEISKWLGEDGREELESLGALDFRGLPGLRVFGAKDDVIEAADPLNTQILI
ncbi:MAG: hypothetical protein K8T20_04810, partial [Planctomycetes bacterium]|nr:hypothetical protein [Planctomycetota bacterium]